MEERVILRRGGEGYPPRLLDLPEPPERLYVRGDPNALLQESVSVIGARKATPYGIAASRLAGRVAAECDLTLVSGGAMGCDSAAARGALDAGGRTVVVSGCGANRVYPRSSEDVFERAVAQGGAVVSLEGWDNPPRRYSFPKRNPVIAALSRAVFIAEAGERSGTLGTALAAEQVGRDLYVVPGSIFSPTSQGANQLIADGAYVITSERDLEARISLDYDVVRASAGDGDGRPMGRVLSALLGEPMRADDLARHLDAPVLDVIRCVSDYEARGVVERMPDGRFSLSAEAYLARERTHVPDGQGTLGLAMEGDAGAWRGGTPSESPSTYAGAPLG